MMMMVPQPQPFYGLRGSLIRNMLAKIVVVAMLLASTQAFAPLHHRTRMARNMGIFSSATEDNKESATSTLERLDHSAVSIVIPVPGSATQAALDKVCREVSKSVTIPGFRQGAKIPLAVLQQAVLQRSKSDNPHLLETQAIHELVGSLVEPTLTAQNVQPIGQPELLTPAEELAKSFKAGQDMTLHVKCDVWPDIEWVSKDTGSDAKPYVGLKGKYSRARPDPAKLQAALSDLQERYATLEEIADPDHTLSMGEACMVNMEGYLAKEDGSKGEALPQGVASGDNVEVILGSGRYMEGLVEGLVGAKVGDQVEISVTFPDVRILCACVRKMLTNTMKPYRNVCIQLLIYFFSRFLRNSVTKLWRARRPFLTSRY